MIKAHQTGGVAIQGGTTWIASLRLAKTNG